LIKEKKQKKKAVVEPIINVVQELIQESEDEKELLVLAPPSQRKALEEKKDLQIQRLQKRCLDLKEDFDKKELDFNEKMKLYQDTNKVLTGLLAKSQDSISDLRAKGGQEIFVLKSIYESAEAEYIRQIQNLKKEMSQQAPSRKQQDLIERLNSDLRHLCIIQEKLGKELGKAHEECQILKKENLSLETGMAKVERMLHDNLLERDKNLTRLEKMQDENDLLKKNLKQLVIQIQSHQETSHSHENNAMSERNQMLLEHESEIRIWKSKVSELQAYLNSSNQKLKLLEDQIDFSREKSPSHKSQCRKGSSSSPNLSRGSSLETLNNLAEEDSYFLSKARITDKPRNESS
jgi:hypothetical protein